MTLPFPYRQNLSNSTPLSLDTLLTSASFFAGKWSPDLKRNQSRDTVGKKVGTDGKTAEPSAFCVRVLEALDRIGKTADLVDRVLVQGRSNNPQPDTAPC